MSTGTRKFIIGNKNLSKAFFILAVLLVSSIISSGNDDNLSLNQEIYEIFCNNRPEIDLQSIPKKSYEQGRIRIKLNPLLRGKVPTSVSSTQNNYYISTGIAELDRLNSIYRAYSLKPLISRLYDVSPASAERIELHRAWGFDLWYEIELDKQSDIKKAVKEYRDLSCIDHAEPVYRTRMLSSMSSTVDEKSGKHTPDDPYFDPDQWSLYNYGQVINGTAGTAGCDIDVQNAWDLDTGWDYVTVAVIDSGIDYIHEDLSANMWSGIGPDGAGTVADNNATHMAGIIAAVTDNSAGIAGIAGGSGTGDGARLMSIDMNGSHGLSIPEMYIYAADNGAAVSVNSWSYTATGVYEEVDLDAIDYFNQHGGGSVLEGGLTVFSAGDSGSTGLWYPACYDGVMAVASTDNKDKKDRSSNYGTWVDISAPGKYITSTGITNTYIAQTGTSMAAAHVAGTAALIISHIARNGIVLDPDEISEIIKKTRDEIDSTNPLYRGMLGTGRLNAGLALAEAENVVNYMPYYDVAITNRTGDADVQIGETYYYTIRVRNNGLLNDAYIFSLDADWAVGLYADMSDTPVDVPLILDPLSYVDLYLKVTVPVGTQIWTLGYDTVTVSGTWIPRSVTVTTTASDIITFYEEDFSTCPDFSSPDPGWKMYMLGGTESFWSCHPDGYMYHDRNPNPNNLVKGWLVSPLITIPDGNTVISLQTMWNEAEPGYTQPTQGIYISTGSGDPNSGEFVLVTQVINDGYQNVWHFKEYDISEYTGMDVYVGFYYEARRDYHNWHIDDIKLSTVPPRPLPFTESFMPGSATRGWKVVQGASKVWSIVLSSFAGGEENELNATYFNTSETTRYYTPPLDVEGLNTVSLKFLTYFEGISSAFTAKIQYKTDITGWADTGWQLSGGLASYGPGLEEVLIDIPAGATSLYIAWVGSGDHKKLQNWYIDTVVVDQYTITQDYAVSLDNITGDSSVQIGESFYYLLRVRNIGLLDDNFSLTASGDWAVGLYADTADTPLPDPLFIASGNYTDIYLKVTVPSGTAVDTVAQQTAEASGNGSYDSLIISTTAVTDFLDEDFTNCVHSWSIYQMADATSVSWDCQDDYMFHSVTPVGEYAENWLVSPQRSINPAKSGQLYLNVLELFQYPESYVYHGIWISTGSGDPNDGDFVEYTELEPVGSTNTWYERAFNFSDYAGSDVYIAFVYRGANADYWAIDSVTIIDDQYEWPVEEYQVTFTVYDYLGNPLQGLNIWVWEQGNPSEVLVDQDTDSAGQVICMLEPGTYDFDVYDYYEAYEYYTGSFTVVDQAIAVPPVYLNLTEFSVEFEILDESGLPVEGALIDITGATNPPATDINGLTTTILTKGSYDYSISHACYETLYSNVDIGIIKSNASRQKPKTEYSLIHYLTEAVFKASFSVTDGTEPVMGAKINISGELDPVVTDISGQGEADLGCGCYTYSVDAGNYDPYEGVFDIAGAKHSISIELSYSPVFISPAISLDYTQHRGIWLWSYDESKSSDINSRGSSWTNILHGITAEKMLAGDITGDGEIELTALLSEYGLWYYSIADNMWTNLIPDDACIDFALAFTKENGPSEIISSIRDHGIYRWDHSAGNIWPSSWNKIFLVPAEKIISVNFDRDETGIDELAMVFYGHSGLYIYTFEDSSLLRIVDISPSSMAKADITDDGFNELIIAFEGLGIYLMRYADEGLRNINTCYPGIDLINDIRSNNEWAAAKGSNLQFFRITWGTPDPDHDIGTGDIALGFGSEIFITYSGSSCYYSYDSLSWHPLLYSPLCRIISSRFTGNPRDDLIVCDSSTGSIYLYSTRSGSWSLLAESANSSAMTAID